MRINHNLPALQAHNALSANELSLQKAIQRLSTGLRINAAADDSAGLGVSEKMRSQVRGTDQAIRNVQDGVSMLQTAEGALGEIHSMLHRMRELSVQAANDVLTSQDRQFVQLEIDQLKEAIDGVAKTTQFNKKRLIDGTSDVLWSSDRLSTEVIVRGGLLPADELGQTATAAGNYRIEITTKPGAGQVRKSTVFNAEYDRRVIPTPPPTPSLFPGVVIDLSAGTEFNNASATSGTGWDFSTDPNVLHITGNGTYQLTGATNANRVVVDSGVTANIILFDANIDSSNGCSFDMTGASVTMILHGSNTLKSGGSRAGIEVPTGASLTIFGADENASLNVTGGIDGAGIGGQSGTGAGTIIINSGVIDSNASSGEGAGIGGGYFGAGGVIEINGGTITARGGTSVIGGAGIGAGHFGNGGTVTINGGLIYAFGGGHGSGIGGAHGTGGTVVLNGGGGVITGGSDSSSYGDSAAIGGGFGNATVDITLAGEYNGTAGILTTSSGEFSLKPGGSGAGYVDGIVKLEDYLYIYERTRRTLREIPDFYTNAGTFTVQMPQTIVISQNGGKSAFVTFYADDTLFEAAKKINDAIADSLGQGVYTSGHFCSVADGTPNTSESVFVASDPIMSEPTYDLNGNIVNAPKLLGYNAYYSTFLVRSVIPGAAGELHFSGDEDLINALGLNVIQESRESEYTVTVYDAHTNKLVTPSRKISGNVLHGDVTENIDVRFDPLANTDVTWNEAMKRYDLTQSSEVFVTTVHLSDNSTVLQIGANERERMNIDFGDMSASALGLDGVLVISRETAQKAITRLDRAIGIVSAQRARLGAYQNRLEHTAANLTVASTNLTGAESRIRDADMAQEMLNFTRLQILLQNGTAMLGQANQMPQNVLSLLRG